MSKNKYLISKHAIKDLNDIWLYTYQRWSIEQADRYYELLIGEIEFIAENYQTGKSLEQIRKNYRVSKIKSHLIFYRKSETGLVEIIRSLLHRFFVKNKFE